MSDACVGERAALAAIAKEISVLRERLLGDDGNPQERKALLQQLARLRFRHSNAITALARCLAGSGADLQPIELRLVQNGVLLNTEEYAIRLIVRNHGRSAANSFDVLLRIIDPVEGTSHPLDKTIKVTSSLAPGQAIDVLLAEKWKPYPHPDIPWGIYAIVDPNNVISEANEENNVIDLTKYILPTPPLVFTGG